MNWFYSFVTSVCVASICFGALYIICPDGKMSKSVKYIFSLSYLLIMIAIIGITVKKSDFNFDFSSQSIINTENIDISTAEYVYGLALKKAGIEFSRITVFTDNLSQNGISINKVLIYSDCDRQRILTALGQAAENFEVEVINE